MLNTAMLRFFVLAIAVLVFAQPARADNVRGVTDTEIVIGSYTDLSGVTAVWGVNNNNAWRMMFDEVNAAGGINGRKIRFITEDNQYQVPRSVQAANKLINRDNVFIMIANDGTPMNNATMPDQLAKGVPNMFPLTAARSMYHPFHHLKFGLAASYYDMMRAGVKLFVEQRGRHRICAMSQDTDFGRDVMDGARDQLKAMNVALVAETLHKPTDTDFSAAVAKLHDAGCDLVLLGTIVRDTLQIVSAVRKAGWNVDLLGQVAIYDQAVAEVPGGVTEGVNAMTSILYAEPTDPRPAVQAFVKKYQALYGREPNFAAQVGVMGAELVIRGLRDAGRDLTVESYIAATERIKDHHDIFGSPPMSFGPDRHQGSTESFLTVVKNGHWVPVDTQPVGY
jgi:branched-chain amino acid transport system substrate-binding protein